MQKQTNALTRIYAKKGQVPIGQQSCAHTDYAMPWCGAHLHFAGLRPAVGLHPALCMVDHTTSITCHYLSSFYTGSKLYCMVTEAQVCEQLVQGCYVKLE